MLLRRNFLFLFYLLLYPFFYFILLFKIFSIKFNILLVKSFLDSDTYSISNVSLSIIKLKYFGVATSNYPSNIELPEDSTIEYLLHEIKDKINDPIDTLLKSAVILINKSKADKNTILCDGDEVLILYVLGEVN